MKTTRIATGIIAAALASTALTGANAQTEPKHDDVVIMRRVIALPTRKSGGANVPRDASWLVGAWRAQTEGICGVAGQEVRPVQCVDGGKAVADAMCAGHKPETTRAVEGDQSSCYFNWVAGPWSDPMAACGASKQHRTMTCNSSTGNVVDDTKCTTAKGATEQPSYDYSLCEYQWSVEGWGDWDSMCSAKASRTRPVYCNRADGGTVDDTQCAGSGPKPDTVDTASITTGCAYEWRGSPWTPIDDRCVGIEQTRSVSCVNTTGNAPVSTALCDPTSRPESARTSTPAGGCEPKNEDGSPQTYEWRASPFVADAPGCGDVPGHRTVACVSSGGTTMPDARCAGEKPSTSGTANDFSTCSYAWITGEWGSFDNTCSTGAVRRRSVSCNRSDGTGVEGSKCDGATMPHVDEQAENLVGCTYAWMEGEYGEPAPACGATTRMIASTCVRSDGTTVGDGACNAATKPATTQAATDYSTCSYAWAVDTWGNYAPTCSTNATRTRAVRCMRSDDQAVADLKCSDAKPAGSDSGAYYAGCSYGWDLTGWAGTGGGCGTYTQTATYACRRSDDTVVPDASCPAPKPTETREQDDATTCGYAWSAGPWGTWNAACSGNAVRERAVTCRRSDGRTAPDPSCAGQRPATTETGSNYSGCGYAWETGEWQQGNPSCGNVTQTRTLSCRRSDDTLVDASLCPSTTRPAATRSEPDTRACTYSWSADLWSAYSSTCSATATRTRPVTCTRSDGTPATDASCTGTKPVGSETGAVYSGCSYAWAAESYGAWSSTCSSTATRAINWKCRRSDGSYVADASCTAAKPAGTSAPTNVTTSCEQAVNGDFSNGLAGYYGLQGVTVVDGGGGNMVAKFTTTGSAPSYIARDYSIVNGRTYKVHIEWTAAMTSGQCSSGSSYANAAWRFPNGMNGGAQGNFFLDGQMCGTNKYIKDYTFRADYTGPVQLVLWLAPPGTAQVTAYADNISFYMVP